MNGPMTLRSTGVGSPLGSDVLLQVDDLKTYFYSTEGVARAVDGVTLSVERGKVLGIVGESGCGKSAMALSVLRILPPAGRIVGGRILYWPVSTGGSPSSEPLDLVSLSAHGRQMRRLRGGEIAMVFQEPMTSLDPVYTVGDQIGEAVLLHQGVSKDESRQRAIETLRRVGLPDADRLIDAYPHQISGGMRQRVNIAIALSCQPRLLIADEPTTALDVTTEAQILDLLRRLQQETHMAIIYITHNLGVIAEMSHGVIVMYLGKVAEKADVDTLFSNPKHPYTIGLLNSIPRFGRSSRRRLEPIKGMVPDSFRIPHGCPYWPRCTRRIAGVCEQVEPANILVAPGHEVRCHLYSP